jgi:uncharacterized protein YutE (UPF0331/DUF86 family)
MRSTEASHVFQSAGRIREYRRLLDRLAGMSLSEFLSDDRTPAAAKYLLLAAFESAAEMCTDVITRQRARAPQDYADCFTVLLELGAISADAAEALRSLAGFRNALVHSPWQVENEDLHSRLQADLRAVDIFVSQILTYLNL